MSLHEESPYDLRNEKDASPDFDIEKGVAQDHVSRFLFDRVHCTMY